MSTLHPLDFLLPGKDSDEGSATNPPPNKQQEPKQQTPLADTSSRPSQGQKVADKKSKSQRRIEGREECARVAQMIGAHIQNGGGWPLTINVECPYTLEILGEMKNDLPSMARQNFFQALADVGLTKKNVRVKRYMKKRKDGTVGQVIINRA